MDTSRSPRRLEPSLFFLAVLALLGVAGTGCGRSGKAPAAVAIEEVKPKMDQAFNLAAPEVKIIADDAVSALQQNDTPKAFVQFEALAEKPDLTDEQRAIANRSMLAVMAQMQKAATNGDERASQFIQMRRARK